MTTFKVLLEYDGSRYSGWQDQKNARTVMGELRQAAREVFRSDVEMQGAGRTDAGVHALGQVAHVKVAVPVRHKPDVIKSRLNDLLPADIVVLEVSQVHRSFHARHDAISRVYRYQISNRKQAFMKKYVWWVKEPLDLDRMRDAAARFAGMHDFQAFSDDDPEEKSTNVLVEDVTLAEDGDLILVRVGGSHFIWKMVRRMVGVLVAVGTGDADPADIWSVDAAPLTAPASGLFLERVFYAGDERQFPLRPAIPVLPARG